VLYEAEGWGVGELWVEGELLVWHELPRPAGPPRASSRFQPTREPVTEGEQLRVGSVTISELADRLGAYFSGRPETFDDVEIDLGWCTPFQRAVTAALRGISRGETVTYGELAALAGHPHAQRAAGTFCARNRFPILVPCHRVVAADGIGSYGSLGIEYKQRLLELERAF
jgi:methylated-DNA-[protein]-cysteine S-methyltransferase